jgi:diguanylate cyclase
MTPVEIARQALRRLAELGLPPTPEHYEREYRQIGGLPPAAPRSAPAQAEAADRPAQPASKPDTLDMVRALLQVMTSANIGLHADLTRFTDESTTLLEKIEVSQDAQAVEELFRAMTASSSWLLAQVDNTRGELERTREQLDLVHAGTRRTCAWPCSTSTISSASTTHMDTPWATGPWCTWPS